MGRGQMSRLIRASKRSQGAKHNHNARQNGKRGNAPTYALNYKGICYMLIFSEQGIPEFIHKSVYNSRGS